MAYLTGAVRLALLHFCNGRGKSRSLSTAPCRPQPAHTGGSGSACCRSDNSVGARDSAILSAAIGALKHGHGRGIADPTSPPVDRRRGRGALPAPEPERRDLASDGAKWLTAAALVLAVAGGYWAFAQNDQGKLEQARALSEAKRQTPDREAKPAAEQRPAQAPQHGAEAGRASAQTARRDTQAAAERAETARKRIEPAVQTAAVPDAPPRSLANAPAAAAGVADGLYAGPN